MNERPGDRVFQGFLDIHESGSIPLFFILMVHSGQIDHGGHEELWALPAPIGEPRMCGWNP